MNNIEFAKNIPAVQLAEIFKSFFEQHMIAYGILKNVEFVSINNVSMDCASITYSVKLINQVDREALVKYINSRASTIVMYGKSYHPEVFFRGDLLCLTIKK